MLRTTNTTTAVLLVVLNISTQRAYCSYYDPICELQNNNGRRRSNGKVNCVVKNLLQSETCEKNAATRVLFLSTDLESNIIHLLENYCIYCVIWKKNSNKLTYLLMWQQQYLLDNIKIYKVIVYLQQYNCSTAHVVGHQQVVVYIEEVVYSAFFLSIPSLVSSKSTKSDSGRALFLDSPQSLHSLFLFSFYYNTFSAAGIVNFVQFIVPNI